MKIEFKDVPSDLEYVTDLTAESIDDTVELSIGAYEGPVPAWLNMDQVEMLRDFLTAVLDARK